MNPYEVLHLASPLSLFPKLGPHSSEREIKLVYHSLALKFHPDKVGSKGSGKFLEIVKAYETLSCPSSRLMLDNIIKVEEERNKFMESKNEKWKEMRKELLKSEKENTEEGIKKIEVEMENSLLFSADSIPKDIDFNEIFGYLPDNIVILPSIDTKNNTIEGICQFKNRKIVDLVMKRILLVGDGGGDEFYKLFKPFISLIRVVGDINDATTPNKYAPFNTFDEIESDTMVKFMKYITKT